MVSTRCKPEEEIRGHEFNSRHLHQFAHMGEMLMGKQLVIAACPQRRINNGLEIM